MDKNPTQSRFAFVLVRPKVAGNIGAAARALKNMGFTDLRIVAAETATAGRAAEDMAVHARDLLENAARFDRLEDALADVALTVGTSARSRMYRSRARTLREFAPELISESRKNRIAILFGPEDHGLSNDELKICHHLITIPTSARYKSINLAQAVMLTAYELATAAGAIHIDAPEKSIVRATIAETEAMQKRFEAALIAIGFLPEDNPDHIMFALREIFGRSGLDHRECDILSGITRQIEWFAAGGRETVTEKRRTGRKLR